MKAKLNHTPVFIAGAGPTGLAMASFLKQWDIPFRIIDKSISSSEKSKALVVQARTLELFQQLGIIEKAKKEIHLAPTFTIHNQGKEVASVEFNVEDDSKLPFTNVAILPQDRTEKVLIEYLEENEVNIEWNTSLENIEEVNNQVKLTIKKSDNTTETVHADYLVGADGAHSIVRKSIDTDFVGGTYESGFMLADVHIDWDITKRGFLVFMEKQFFCLFFPFKEKGKYRLISLVPKARDKVDFKFMKSFIESNLSLPLTMSNPEWISNYSVHHRCVEHFRQNRIFLAGDSAHIHSPAGGQGMNTGIQDAHNLAWKLAMKIKGVGNEKLLDSYHLERWRIAQNLVKGTDRGFSMMANASPFLQWFRTNVMVYIMGAVFSFKKMQQFAFRMISQTSINYERHYKNYNHLKHPMFTAGTRFPWYKEKLANGKNIYDLLTMNSYHLFVFGGTTVEGLNSRFGDFLTVHHFENQPALLEHYKIKTTPVLVLVRPDMHIACVSDNAKDIEKYASDFLSS